MKITFTIDNFDEQTFNDTAKILGYKSVFEKTERKTTQIDESKYTGDNIETLLEDGAFDISVSESDTKGKLDVTYYVTVQEPNPQTVKEFYYQLFIDEFVNEKIKPAAVKAKTRAFLDEVNAAKAQIEQTLQDSITISVD